MDRLLSPRAKIEEGAMNWEQIEGKWKLLGAGVLLGCGVHARLRENQRLARRGHGAGMTKRPRAGRRSPRRRTSETKRRRRTRYWSAAVTERSNALDLEAGVFTLESPRAIAASLKRSAEHSRRRRSPAYRSAMSMLTFYINRAGVGLSPARRRVLEQAKTELRHLFGRTSR
jgi:hypothetical protein